MRNTDYTKAITGAEPVMPRKAGERLLPNKRGRFPALSVAAS